MPTTRPALKVSIIGAGFAGLAAAALLARQGHRVTVHERFTEPQALGAGILIQPSGLAAMQVLGVDAQVLRLGARIDHLYGVTPSQRPVVNVRYAHWQAGSCGIGLHRSVLFSALWALAQHHGADIQLGQEVQALSDVEADCDLAIVADGARSRLRAQTGLPVHDREYPWGALWAVLDDPQGRQGSTLWQWYRGAQEMLGLMPTGRALAGGEPLVSLFWSLHASRLDAWRERGLAAFKQQVLALNPNCAALLEQLTSTSQLTWARYHDVVMPRYHRGHCVVIGDAAHATSPQLGQGTNLALLDAVALSQCIAQAPVAQALEAYTRLRKPHLHFYGQASRWLTPLFQSDLCLLPWLRDAFMNMSTSLPVIGGLTRQTLVGVRQGWMTGTQLDLREVSV